LLLVLWRITGRRDTFTAGQEVTDRLFFVARQFAEQKCKIGDGIEVLFFGRFKKVLRITAIDQQL